MFGICTLARRVGFADAEMVLNLEDLGNEEISFEKIEKHANSENL
jgi:hypothetical protein